MAMTSKEMIEGVALTKINVGLISDKPDAIELLSESKQFETTLETHKRIYSKDGNVVSTVNSDGTVTNDTDLAKLQDRTYAIESWEFPPEERIRVSIPHEKLYQYGINNANLNKQILTKADGTEVTGVIAGLQPEFQKLLRKIKTYRRNQVKHLLNTLQAPTLDWQKTMGGYAIVDVSANRPDFFNYTNKLSVSAISTDAFDEALDILAGSQKNIDNDDFQMGSFIAGLHATRYSLIEKQVNPSGSVNINDRSMADALNGGSKYVGVYNDTDNPADWIILGYGHTIRRLNFGGIGVVNGIKVEIHEVGSGGTQEENAYGVELVAFVRSIMVVDSPNGIVKCCVA